jgi:GNAT superfamily N-acetyltransferase
VTLEELAEDTAVHLLPRGGFEMTDRGTFMFEATAVRAAVHRLRLADVDGAVAWTRDECARRGIRRCEWWVGWSARPSDLVAQLQARGFVPDDEQATLTGMTCDREPPAAPHVDVRRIMTIDEQLAALAVDWEVWGVDEAERARQAEAEPRRFDPHGTVHHFAAFADGRPVGFARAIDMDDGVALMGGVVLPEHRGRGVYRALVRARWAHAAARGTPLLVVQAGSMSAPVLDGLGFRRHGDLHLLMDPGVTSRHGDDRDEHGAG